MKAIIYCRFSPRKNHEVCESNETQLEYCRAYAKKAGWDIVGEYSDEAMSGKEYDRPGLWQAVDALRAGYVLLVYRLDRIARDVYLSITVERQIAKKRAKIVSVSGEGTWNDTPENKLLRGQMRLFAEYEREIIAARTKAAMLRHQATGRRMSGQPPYGYQRDPSNPALLIPEPAEQEIIARIKELSASGAGARSICRTLTDDFVQCRGGKWHHRTVQNVLRRHKQ